MIRPVPFYAVLLLFTGCYKEAALPVTANFEYQAVNNGFTVPVTLTFSNTSVGAESFKWTFEGGDPGTSAKKTPGEVIYRKPGIYNVRLEVSNFDGSQNVVEKKVTIDAQLKADFSYSLAGNAFAPVVVNFSNASAGYEKVEWSFEGGTPATSTQQQPVVTFENGGPHKIRLTIFNSRESVSKDTLITFEPELTPAFSIEIPKQFEELEAPVTLQLKNTSVGNTVNLWQTEGADVSQSQEKEPIVRFSKAGTYTILLEINNGKKTKKTSQSITIKPSKGYAYIKDVELGIYAAKSDLGVFYSTTLRKAFKESDPVTAGEAAAIDLLFFGLNDDFSFNRFLSPDAAASAGINPIPGTGKTIVLNPANVGTVPAFESMGEAQLNALEINRIVEDPDNSFNETGPKIVLFENAQKKKGALLIKEFIKDGAKSRIKFDIKVLK
ncbi:PKD domain-containing protein [Runella sp.]|uniref:PKD domain-containing protein n=1 Tax=Runella sp. TaxID=1960881 RepID=UPI003D10E98E